MNYYLFDFDGTLVDSMPSFVMATTKILEDHHIPFGEDLVRIITPLGGAGTADYFVKLGVPLSREEIIAAIGQNALEEYTHRIPAKPHVIDTLRKLKERGDSLSVLTASPHITLDPCLKRLGIFDWFQNVWSCDDFGTTKADPEIYCMAAEKIGAPVEEIWFLDDNLNADRTAKQAGMKVCGVYDLSSAEDTEAIQQATDAYIYNFSQLLDRT